MCPKLARKSPKSEQKAQKSANTSSKWLCISSSSALRESYKNIVFYYGFGASKLSKTTQGEPKGAHEAILYAQKQPKRQHKSHSDTSSETGPKKIKKRHKKGCQKQPRKGSESRSEKGSENDVRQLAQPSGAGSETQITAEP